MATNLSVEAPDFDQIRKESGIITSNAVKLLWEVINYEIAQRRASVRAATIKLQGRATGDGATAQENNLDIEDSLVWYWSTASSFGLTGIRNGFDGRVVFLHNIGAGTISLKNESGSSDAANRILTKTAGDTTIATNESAILMYINQRWREWAVA